jgi:hypothetical protein
MPKNRKKSSATTDKSDATPQRKRVSKKNEAGTIKEAGTIEAPARNTEAPARNTGAPALEVSDSARPQSIAPASAADVRKPDPAIARVVSREERQRMIAEAAYHKSLLRHPGAGNPQLDWYEAEAEIDTLLAEQEVEREQ